MEKTQRSLAPIHSSICLRAAGKLPQVILRLRDSLMWQPLAGCQNCDQQVHKPQFAVNALCHLSFTLKIKAPFFAAGSISPTPGMYFFKTAKSQTFSTTCGSSHQPMAISRTILFTRNFKTSFYHILLTSVTHGSVYNSREHILKNI